jgi:hypothetical protein
MSGYDSPQLYDMTLVAELRRPSSVDGIRMATDRMVAQGQIMIHAGIIDDVDGLVQAVGLKAAA